MWTETGRCEPRPTPTPRDSLIAAALTIGAALVVAAILLVVDHPAAKTIGLTMTPGVLLLGTQWLYLRDRSWRVRIAMVAGPLLVLFLIGLVAAGLID